MLRRLIAAVGHAPALWLFYREPLPHAVRRPNAIAVGATLMAMAAAGLLAEPANRWSVVFWTWIVGHFAWGAYLLVKLPEPLSGD